MPDRRRRTALRHPLPERSSLLMRERQSPTPGSSSSSSSSSSPAGSSGPQDDNPFAPPPEDRPDQPWQPRRPANGGTNGEGDGESGDAPEGGSSDNRPVWGSQWSSHQPGRQNGTFGGRPTGPGGPNGQGGPDGPRGGLRWDPKDPVQRRARYSLLSGMWAFFFALFDFPEIALLLGALATYWSISALRAKSKEPTAPGEAAGAPGTTAAAQGHDAPSAPAPATGATAAAAPQGTNYLQRGSRQQTTATVSGLVTGLIALLIVATSFTVQLVYRDYYTCVNDALTKSGQLTCNDLLPKPLEPLFGVKN
ncbi:hypothetical protein [Streptomyces sp. NBC_00236]|uniref:hypothetical protein n=1 Tax=Streptomyces sp. NBC_00236 TaxID=2903639 RepID=UPI002E2C698E|nr:hypothetical protein [Streptomyces sp. NBC_00236]